MKAFVEITRSNRTTYRQPLTGSKMSFGRSSRCDISLPEESELQAEHLFIIPDKAGCQVRLSRQARTPFFHKGQALRTCIIPWGEDIFVKTIRLRMAHEPSDTDRTTIRTRSVLFVLLLLGTGAWLWLERSPINDSHTTESLVASVLFELPVECSQPNLALYRARETERAAFAKMQRYYFNPQDGVEAVRLISEARACYQAEKATSQVTRVQKTLDAWKRLLERDYRHHRLRLRLALSNAQYEEARRTARILRDLLSRRDDSYTKWLDRIERNPNAN